MQFEQRRGGYRYRFADETGPVVTDEVTHRNYAVTDVIVSPYGRVVEVLLFGQRLTKAGQVDLRCGLDRIENSDFEEKMAEAFRVDQGWRDAAKVRIERREISTTIDGQDVSYLWWGTWIRGQHVGMSRTRLAALQLVGHQLAEET
jgi:hypothetical protein